MVCNIFIHNGSIQIDIEMGIETPLCRRITEHLLEKKRESIQHSVCDVGLNSELNMQQTVCVCVCIA